MDFFDQQELARRTSRRLLLWYLLAALFVIASFNVVAAAGYAVLATYGALPLAGGEPLVWRGLLGTYLHALVHVPAGFHLAVSGVVGAIVAAVSAWRIRQLSEGGPAIAEMLGAHFLERGRASPAETRLLNTVEEMAIASGIVVPPVYILAAEDAVNALAAGHTPNESVIVVTRGAVQKLSRDELQAVMGHEFSHILNGDMALNLRLVGLLAGLTCFGELGERLVYGAARQARGKSREEIGGEAVSAIFGTLIAFIGFPGSVAAEAIKAAISRQRELLADAASVQFTRNPDGIAGALDSVRYLKAGTTLRAAYTVELSHMFFLPAIVRWWTFRSHPPIEERIRWAHPRFMQEDYRRTRHASTYDDGRRAVLDGSGNIVKVVGGIGTAAMLAAAMSAPRPEHVDYARRLLERLPQPLRHRLATPEGAEQVIFGLLGAGEEQAAAARFELQGIGRQHYLLLIELALPALKQFAQQRRDVFLAEVNRLVEADQRVTLSEFVQATLLRQHLREGAGKPIGTRYRKVDEVAQDAHVVLSLIAHASNSDAAAAHAKGSAILGIELPRLLPAAQLSAAGIGAALERLRHLEPFAKPRVLKACLETAAADGVFRLAEAELVRAVAATLDCPLPPVIGALDPGTLAA